MSETVATRSPSEALMTCLEEFGKAEPTHVLVVWTDEYGDICWSGSRPSSVVSLLGMLKCVEVALEQDFLKDREKHDS
jgi:hypothetical protein